MSQETPLLTQLSEAQRATIASTARRTLVIGVPGSGRTTAAVGRLAHLLTEGVKPEEIQLLCPSAAGLEHLRRLLAGTPGLTGRPVRLTTYHRAAARIVRKSRGAAPETRLLKPLQQRVLLRQLGFPGTAGELGSLLQVIMLLKEAQLAPDTTAALPAALLAGIDEGHCRTWWQAYEVARDQQAGLDFSDLLLAATARLADEPALAAALAQECRHLILDDLDATSAAQRALLAAWPQATLWATATAGTPLDTAPLQVFTAADTTVCHLERSYRCPPAILRAAEAVASTTSAGMPPASSACAEAVSPPVLVACADEADEVAWVMRVLAMLQEDGVAPAAIAVLLPHATALPGLQAAFLMAGASWRLDEAVLPLWSYTETRLLLLLLAVVMRTSLDDPDEPMPEPCLAGLEVAAPPLRGKPFPALLDAAVPAVARLLAPLHTPGHAAASGEILAALARLAAWCGSVDRLNAVLSGARRAQERAGDGISLTTHAAAAGEWSAVLLPGLEAELVAASPELAYRAMMRARRALLLSWARRRGGQPRQPAAWLTMLNRPEAGLLARLTWPAA